MAMPSRCSPSGAVLHARWRRLRRLSSSFHWLQQLASAAVQADERGVHALQVVLLVGPVARDATVGDNHMPVRIEQQLMRLEAAALPFIELLQRCPVAHADSAAPRGKVGFRREHQVARRVVNGMAIEQHVGRGVDVQLAGNLAFRVDAE